MRNSVSAPGTIQRQTTRIQPRHPTNSPQNCSQDCFSCTGVPQRSYRFEPHSCAGHKGSKDKTKAKAHMQAPQAGQKGALLRFVKPQGHTCFLHSLESNQIRTAHSETVRQKEHSSQKHIRCGRSQTKRNTKAGCTWTRITVYTSSSHTLGILFGLALPSAQGSAAAWSPAGSPLGTASGRGKVGEASQSTRSQRRAAVA